jgi:hypothetical protein
MKLRKVMMTAALLVLPLLMAGTALAQDFGSLVSAASSANSQFVQQTDSALQATDLTTLQAGARTAVATGKQVQSDLQTALSIAPDDASRSRVQGVLTHITAAVSSGQSALQASDFSTARGAVDAMRGEAQEALTEVAPSAGQPTTTSPVQLPSAGEAGSLGYAPLLAAIGAMAAAAGLGLRRRTA